MLHVEQSFDMLEINTLEYPAKRVHNFYILKYQLHHAMSETI